MTDVSRDAGVWRGRAWWSTVLAVVVLHAVGLGIVVAWEARYYGRLVEICPGADDEGTIAAPRSLQARLVCGDSGVSWTSWVVVAGAVALVLLVALALWLCRRTALAVVAVLLAALVPAGLTETSLGLDDSCSKAQWTKYGDQGCEQDLELR